MKFRTQLITFNSITLAMLSLICIIVFINVNRLLDNTKWVEFTYKVIGNSNQLLGYVVDQETGMNGYVVIGIEEFLEPYDYGVTNFDELIAELKQTMKVNPSQVERLQEVENLALSWKTNVAEKYIEMRREIKKGEELRNEINQIITSEVGRGSMEKLRQLLLASGLPRVSKDIIQKNLLEVENQLQSYIITEEEAYLKLFEQHRDVVASDLRRYRANVGIRNAYDEWRAEYAEKLVALIKEESVITDMDELYAEFEKKEGKQYIDKIREVIAAFAKVEYDLLSERLQNQESTANNTKTILLASTMLAIIIGVFAVFYIIKSVMEKLGGEPAEVAGVVSKVADGVLSIQFDKNKTYKGLYKSMIEMIENLRNTVLRVSDSANSISEASKQMSSSAQEMSIGASDQASSSEEVSASMEEMTANIQQNASSALEAEKIAIEAVQDVQKGKSAVDQTVDSMKEIAERVTVIGEFARKTNILALNAAVEAARAGEAGKGFAVVAAEVRRLAENSQSSAVAIDDLCKTSVGVADEAGQLFEKLMPGIQKTAQIVKQITQASEEQNSGAEQINSAIQQLNNITQQNAASSQQTASSSRELSMQADTLRNAIEYFDIGESNEFQFERTLSKDSQEKQEIDSPITTGSNGSSLENGIEIDLELDQEDKNFTSF